MVHIFSELSRRIDRKYFILSYNYDHRGKVVRPCLDPLWDHSKLHFERFNYSYNFRTCKIIFNVYSGIVWWYFATWGAAPDPSSCFGRYDIFNGQIWVDDPILQIRARTFFHDKGSFCISKENTSISISILTAQFSYFLILLENSLLN